MTVTYGHDDVPLLIQDRRFRNNGSFSFSARAFSPTGILGDDILINGTPDPFFEVATERVRLRLANGSNARHYNIGFADNRPFAQIATDNGLLEAPHETTRIQLSPGERAEIVIDVRPGETVEVLSYPQSSASTSGPDVTQVATTRFDCSRSAPLTCSNLGPLSPAHSPAHHPRRQARSQTMNATSS